MTPEPQTLTEYKIAYDKLKSDKSQLESQVADAEEIVRRYKAKFGSLQGEPRPGITRVRFDR